MKSKKNIVFLGMMGSGKTSIGSSISKKLDLEFFDTDRFIEKALNMKISKIFKNKGEIFFREYEEKIILDILKKKNIVIALGGGSFLNKKISDEILANHLSFWLKCDNKTIIKRIKNSSKRPIAYNATNNELNDMIKVRSKYYMKAKYKVECSGLSKNEVINQIISIYENKEINN